MKAAYLVAVLAATLAAAAPAPADTNTDGTPSPGPDDKVELISWDGTIITVPGTNVTFGSTPQHEARDLERRGCGRGWSECSWITKYGCYVGCCRIVIY